jgi:aconitate decarboxylase
MPGERRKAAYLAEKGFTGSLDVLEAPFGGFMSTLHGQFEAATILDGLGSRWETALVGIKAYAACASAHTTIDGVRDLRARGLTADNLVRLTIRVSKKSHLNIGWPYKPGEVIAAQMNGFYAAAVTLIDGDATIEQYLEARLGDPEILALIPRIDIVHDPMLDNSGAAKRHAVKIDATCKDGTVLSTAVEQRRGSAEHPLSRDEIEQKFRGLAALALPPSSVDEMIGLVDDLEGQDSIDRLFTLMAGA